MADNRYVNVRYGAAVCSGGPRSLGCPHFKITCDTVIEVPPAVGRQGYTALDCRNRGNLLFGLRRWPEYPAQVRELSATVYRPVGVTPGKFVRLVLRIPKACGGAVEYRIVELTSRQYWRRIPQTKRRTGWHQHTPTEVLGWEERAVSRPSESAWLGPSVVVHPNNSTLLTMERKRGA